MSLTDEISRAMRQSLRSGDKKRLLVLRMLLSELKVAETSGRQFDELAVVKSYAKKLRKTAEEYRGLNLPEETSRFEADLAVVEEFLPSQLDPSEVERIITEIIEQNGYGPRDLGLVMKAVMAAHGDAVDGRVAQGIARRTLSERG